MTTRPTLVFSSGSTWFQVVVQFATLSGCDHVAIGLDDLLLHATDKGIVLEPRAKWERHNRITHEYEILPDVSPGLQGCFSLIGQPYDTKGVIRTGLGLALRRTLAPIRPWAASLGEHTCAGYAMLLDPHGEVIPEWQSLSRRSVAPVDLLDATGQSFRKVQPFEASW